jgi:hypothetical protein
MASRFAKVSIAVGAVTLLGVACVSSGVDTYDEFRGAVDAGAPCDELFDIKAGFDAGRDLDRIERDLEEIGCDTADSSRNDL